ncbi:MAG: hypothetical protein MZV70_42655 [Desulfobacterales bacterium]|nr:hypothetical protein [Desulfobacterales bacterium]
MNSPLPRRRFMSGAFSAAAMLAVGPARPGVPLCPGQRSRAPAAPGSGSASTPTPSTSRCAPAR